MSEHHNMEAVSTASDTPATFRRKVYRLMFEAPDSPPAEKLIDRFIVTLIILSVCAIGVEHIDTLHEKFKHELELFDKFSVYFFTLEYLVRLYCIPESEAYQNFKLKRLRYAVTPMALVDFFVIVPFYLTFLIEIDLRFLRLLRLLRVLKLVRFIVPKIQEFRDLNQGRTFKQKVYSVLNEDEYSGDIAGIIDTTLVLLIAASVTAVVLESVQPIHELLEREFHIFDTVSVFIFSLEYVFRIYSITENPEYKERIAGRVRYGTTILSLIDLLSILPFYLTFFISMDLRFLRVMRLLRILKLTRYSTAMQTLISVVRDELPVLSAALFVSLLISLFASSAIYILEHEAQPDKFNSIPEAMYWSIITLTSVGYGDYYPVTPLGQFFASAAAIIGVVLVALPTGMLASGFSEKIRLQKDELNKMADEAAADGVITEAEHRMMERRAHRMGIADHVEMEIENQAIERAQAHMAELAAAPPPPPPLKAEIKTMLIQLETFTTEEKTQLLSHLADSLSRDVTQAQKLAQGSAVKV